LPAPYNTKGIGGANVEMILVDESGPTTQVVQEYRNLVERRNVDAVVGYVSSGNCLGVAPVAEELKKLTVLFDCGTPRIFEESPRQFVFRTSATAVMDGVGAARYIAQKFPAVKTYGGINQNYAWGQDSWRDFSLAMQALKPGTKVTTEQWPKLMAGQFNSEISALLLSKSNLVHTSLWGGDLESFIVQASGRQLDKNTKVLHVAGEHIMFRMADKIPNGTIIGARGPYGVFARDNELNRWFQIQYRAKTGVPPIYAAYHMANGLLGLKAAADRAMKTTGKRPTQDQIINAFRGLEFEAPGVTVKMALAKGHQAITETAYGIYQYDAATKTPKIVDVVRFPAECVNPPDGIDSVTWLKGGMKGAKC
jgi:branched-chain amino acid transport system substrate-binding protein